MVKFGRHLNFFQQSAAATNSYVVDYITLRRAAIESDSEFNRLWREALARACKQRTELDCHVWRQVFEVIGTATHDEMRGIRPADALFTFLKCSGADEAQGLQARINRTELLSSTNAEALRKLVKKRDKYCSASVPASGLLLPELYSSVLLAPSANPSLMEALARAAGRSTATDESAGTEGAVPAVFTAAAAPRPRLSSLQQPSDAQDEDVAVCRRASEHAWLRDTIARIPRPDLEHLVAHRGFHSPNDTSALRPLENSLNAYEAAWTSGIKLCECDISITRDNFLVLAHDKHYERLALMPESPTARRSVGDLTLRQLIALRLKSGTRPPTLLDVLRSAHQIGREAQLVIEIKPGNSAVATELCTCSLVI